MYHNYRTPRLTHKTLEQISRYWWNFAETYVRLC